MTLRRIESWIREQKYDEETAEGLAKIARGMPNQSLRFFPGKIETFLHRVRTDRLKREGVSDVLPHGLASSLGEEEPDDGFDDDGFEDGVDPGQAADPPVVPPPLLPEEHRRPAFDVKSESNMTTKEPSA